MPALASFRLILTALLFLALACGLSGAGAWADPPPAAAALVTKPAADAVTKPAADAVTKPAADAVTKPAADAVTKPAADAAPAPIITPAPMLNQGPLQPSRAFAPPNLADPAYTSCKETADCAFVLPPCGLPAGVNTSHYIAAKAWYDHVRPSYTCADWIKVPAVQAVTCRASRCAVELGDATTPAPGPAIKDAHYCEADADCVVVLGDCCVKNFVNTQNAGKLKAEIDYNKRLAKCFYPDRRYVRRLRCEKHQCTADLEVPLELRDFTHHTKDRCQQ